MMDMREVWKDIPSFEGIYQASTDGRIKRVSNGPSTYAGRILKPTTHYNGYMEVSLCADGKQYKSLRIHTLVLITFSKPKPDGYQCRHLDGNKQNNRLTNLVWGTSKENANDRRNHGGYKGTRGSKNITAKLTENQVKEIRKLLGSTLKNKHNKGLTLKQIAQQYGVSIPTISAIKIGRTWKNMEKKNGESIK